ncbi:MAG: hypothetical protein WBN66_11965 [Smithella sp.]
MMCRKINFIFIFFVLVLITSCTYLFESPVITKPDEYTRIYEAKEKVVLRAVARVIKERNAGMNVIIDDKNHQVNSDYLVSDKWRTKTSARVRQINWKECEVVIAVTTEKKKEDGWEMRRLLQKDQYDTFFNEIDLKIYEEMSRID